MKKTFYIETFGCQMNKSDSELMELSLRSEGFKKARDMSGADIIVFNTCSVRAHAENRALSRIRECKKKAGDEKIIAVAGCMAQRIGRTLLDRGVGLVIGPYESPGIGRIIRNLFEKNERREHLSLDAKDFSTRIDFRLAYPPDALPWHRWLTISHGCGNYCSYCIVPYVRGRLISFSSDVIMRYAQTLVANGIREITLLGQNVNQYGQDSGDIPFYQLLDRIAGIGGFERINFLTSHPKDFSEDLISVIAGHDNISKSVHLPLQSGSDGILTRMNRKYSLGHYHGIVEKLRRHLPEFSLTTDLIVGYPGETEKDYENTLRAVSEIRFDDAFMYAYSPREGTAAYELEETISRAEKIGRLRRLIDLQRRISGEKLSSRINRVECAIIERISKKSAEKVMGKTFLNHPIIIPGSCNDIGKKIHAKISGVTGSSLLGTRIA